MMDREALWMWNRLGTGSVTCRSEYKRTELALPCPISYRSCEGTEWLLGGSSAGSPMLRPSSQAMLAEVGWAGLE